MEDKYIKIVEELIEGYKKYETTNHQQYVNCVIIQKSLENLLSRLKTAERMNDVLADNLRIIYSQHEPCDIETTEMKRCDKYENCKECIKEWARKKVEDETHS